MKIKFKISILVFLIICSTAFCQIQKNTHVFLNEDDTAIAENVKKIIANNVQDKQFVMLGESFHRSGADLTYKTKVVKYLVKELGYEDIIFESDFFALYDDKNIDNIFGVWTGAEQCKELFEFVKDQNVSLWGMDSKLHLQYSKYNFTAYLERTFNSSNIIYSPNFLDKIDRILDLGFKIRDDFSVKDLESFYAARKIKEGIAIRDKQMAKNLNFLSKKFPNKKFII